VSAWAEMVGKYGKTPEELKVFSDALVEVQEAERQKTLGMVARWMRDLSDKEQTNTQDRFGPFEVVVRDVDTDADDSVPAVVAALDDLLGRRHV
jgi:hypothetical protein